MTEQNIFRLKPNNQKYESNNTKGQKMTIKKHTQNMRDNLKKKIKNKILK